MAFFFQYFLQAGLFFVVPLFLSVALGLSAVATGVRLLPLSLTLLLAAAGVPRVFPHASPRRVVQIGFLCLFAGIVVMLAALDAGAGPEIVTWPMLLAGLGVGALPGPFEYDVKRMAASFLIAARNNGFSKADARAATQASVTAYREAMAAFAQMPTMDVWYAHLDEDELRGAIRSTVAEA